MNAFARMNLVAHLALDLVLPSRLGQHAGLIDRPSHLGAKLPGFAENSPKTNRKLYVSRFTYTFISSGPQPLRGSRQAKSLIFGSLMIFPALFSLSFFPARAQRLPSWMFAAMGPE